MSTTLPIVTRGDKFVLEATMTSVDKALTGATIRVFFRRTLAGPTLIEKSIGAGVVVTSDVVGARKFEVTIEGEETETLSNNDTRLIWDAEVIYGDGDGPYTISDGALPIRPDVTR